MASAAKTENFIRRLFDLYGLEYKKYFFDYDEDNDHFVELPLHNGKTLDMSMVQRAAEILGTDTNSLLSTRIPKESLWINRIPFISLQREFAYSCRRAYFDASYDSIRLIEVLENKEFPKPTRYDYKDVKHRMLALLKEYDKASPGCYHPGAGIRHLRIDTKNFCHFSQIAQLMDSFHEMLARVQTLFFKALDTPLEAEEINEYNIIVSILGIEDRYLSPSKDELHYSMLCKLAPVYKAENRSSFFDYVILNRKKAIAPENFAPWRCIEFIQDKEMVQKYVSVVPQAKAEMRKHALGTANFECSFAWSDAEPLAYISSDEPTIENIAYNLAYLRLRDQFGGLTPTHLYVPKTDAELGEDKEHAAVLMRLCGPSAKGGVQAPAVSLRPLMDLPKMTARISAMRGDRHG